MAILPIAPVERLIRKAGAERVSQDAAEALADVLEDVGIEISQKGSSVLEARWEEDRHC